MALDHLKKQGLNVDHLYEQLEQSNLIQAPKQTLPAWYTSQQQNLRFLCPPEQNDTDEIMEESYEEQVITTKNT